MIVHSIDSDSDQEDEDFQDGDLGMGMEQSKATQEFFTLTNFSNLDDFPSSTIESTMLDFNEALEGAFEEQSIVNLPVTTITTKIPPLVSIEVASTTPSILPSMTKEMSTTTIVAISSGVPQDTTTLMPMTTLITATSSSQPAPEIITEDHQGATTPLANLELPPLDGSSGP